MSNSYKLSDTAFAGLALLAIVLALAVSFALRNAPLNTADAPTLALEAPVK